MNHLARYAVQELELANYEDLHALNFERMQIKAFSGS